MEKDLLGKLLEIQPNLPEGPPSLQNDGKGNDRSQDNRDHYKPTFDDQREKHFVPPK
jgi:hypothetical protein